MNKRTWVIGIVITAVMSILAGTPSSVAGCDFASLQPGHWCAVPNSSLDAIKPGEAQWTNCDGPQGCGYHETVTKAWSGGAFDPDHDRFLIWGGGHGDYAGNEVYAFDIGNLRWARSESSRDLAQTGNSTYRDGSPRSNHTYGNLEYVPRWGRMCSFMIVADYYMSKNWGEVWCNDLDAWDGSTRGWAKKMNVGVARVDSNAILHPATGDVWMEVHSSGWKNLYKIDTAKNTVKTMSGMDENGPANPSTVVIDPVHNILFGVGGGQQYYWDLSKGTSTRLINNSSSSDGGSTVRNATRPGIEWDSRNEQIIAWAGGTETWKYDFAANKWSACVAADANTVTPTAPVAAGTYDRWQYVPSKDAFILYNETRDNVFLYRLPEACDGVVVEEEPSGNPPPAPAGLGVN